eukprot:7207634-Pyramimonas_sp.AAC.2
MLTVRMSENGASLPRRQPAQSRSGPGRDVAQRAAPRSDLDVCAYPPIHPLRVRVSAPPHFVSSPLWLFNYHVGDPPPACP